MDTNIISDLVNHPGGIAAEQFHKIGAGRMFTSIIVAAEARYGAEKKNSARLRRRVEDVLGVIGVLAFEEPADRTYATLRAELDRAGAPIGANDLLIAAQALTLGYTVVTDNEGEFGRVKGLRVENWLRTQ